MNEHKGIRIWQGAVVLLVLCNIGLVLTLWLKPQLQGPPQGRETPRDYVIRNVGFDESQVKKYDLLITAHQRTMHDLRDEAAGYRQALFGGLKEEHSGTQFTDSLTKLIARTQEEIEIVTYNHFAEVRTICTEAQKPEFDRIITDVIKKMNRGPHPPPGNGAPPPGRHGPPPPPPPPDGR